MTTLIVIPYFGCPDLIEKCVRSALAQTDVAVLVMGDGEEPPLNIRDDRLDVVSYRENHGPYWRLQVALLASPFEHFAPVGADDWLEPDHIERLAEAGDNVLTGSVWFHALDGRVSVHEGTYEVGRFTPQAALSFGGYNPDERVGQDTLLIHLMRITGQSTTLTLKDPTYHRVKRSGSLMTSKLTGKGTPYRNDVRRRNREVYAHAQHLGQAQLIAAYRETRVPQHVREQVRREADELSLRLGRAVAA